MEYFLQLINDNPTLSTIVGSLLSACLSGFFVWYMTKKSIKSKYLLENLSKKKELLDKYEKLVSRDPNNFVTHATFFGANLTEYYFAFPDLRLERADILKFDTTYHERLFDYMDINIFELVQVGAHHRTTGFWTAVELGNSPHAVSEVSTMLIRKMGPSIEADIRILGG